jgi:hypothetical protein
MHLHVPAVRRCCDLINMPCISFAKRQVGNAWTVLRQERLMPWCAVVCNSRYLQPTSYIAGDASIDHQDEHDTSSVLERYIIKRHGHEGHCYCRGLRRGWSPQLSNTQASMQPADTIPPLAKARRGCESIDLWVQ